ncbi:MAG: CapA family protein [Solobacterium sp.]|nr:CapA family protein [Solobacterium sp.]
MKNKSFWDTSGKLLLALALVIGIISLTMNIMTFLLERRNNVPQYEPRPQVPQEEVSVINVLALGAVDYHQTEYTDYTPCFSNMLRMIANHDISVYSQITQTGTDLPEDFAKAVEVSGLNSVALANAGSLSHGKEGVETTLSCWQNTGLQEAGLNTGTDMQNLIHVFEKNNISVVYLSYTDILDDELPEQTKYLVNVYDERTPEIVSRAASQADVVIVSVYWEGEDRSAPSARQQQIAKELADAGASVIIGNAPDAIQPAGWIDDTLIFYSLGDLLSDRSTQSFGFAGAVTITKSTYKDNKKIELTNPRVELISTQCSDNTICRVSPYNTITSNAENTPEYQEYVRVIQMLDDSIRIGGLQ